MWGFLGVALDLATKRLLPDATALVSVGAAGCAKNQPLSKAAHRMLLKHWGPGSRLPPRSSQEREAAEELRVLPDFGPLVDAALVARGVRHPPRADRALVALGVRV
jgi:hypothetical protein